MLDRGQPRAKQLPAGTKLIGPGSGVSCMDIDDSSKDPGRKAIRLSAELPRGQLLEITHGVFMRPVSCRSRKCPASSSSPLARMKDQELIDEKVGNVHDVKVDLETVDPEYHDYLALSEEYQGEKLKQLTVSLASCPAAL